MTTTKQTAGNNTLIAAVNKTYNTKIAKHFRQTLNQQGEAAAIAYIQQFHTNKITRESLMEVN
jgi:hypothetical protein